MILNKEKIEFYKCELQNTKNEKTNACISIIC